LNRLPDLKAFLKGGEAELYRGVSIRYVRGKQTTLHVFRDGKEVDSVVLSTLRSKELMHDTMARLGFERKSEEELKADEDRAKKIRRQKDLAMFHRKEYLRKQHLHGHLFRRDVMQGNSFYERSWIYKDKDWLYENYDKIYRGEARTKFQIYEYSVRYLKERR